MAEGEGRTKLSEFLVLVRGAKGAAAAGLIRQALDQQGLYTFAELLQAPNIIEVK